MNVNKKTTVDLLNWVKPLVRVAENEAIKETAYIMSQPELIEAIRQGDDNLRKENYEIVNIDEL